MLPSTLPIGEIYLRHIRIVEYLKGFSQVPEVTFPSFFVGISTRKLMDICGL